MLRRMRYLELPRLRWPVAKRMAVSARFADAGKLVALAALWIMLRSDSTAWAEAPIYPPARGGVSNRRVDSRSVDTIDGELPRTAGLRASSEPAVLHTPVRTARLTIHRHRQPDAYLPPHAEAVPPPAGKGLSLAEPPPEATPLALTPMGELTNNIRPDESQGELPPDYAANWLARQGQLLDGMAPGRDWMASAYIWQAPVFCHQPLYYEEVNLERHGYSFGVVQPAVSAAHFFGTTALLPYKFVAEGRRECVYTLGHYRPGSKVPFHRQ